MDIQQPPPCDLLLSSADLEERRLLLAELMEAGYQVLAVPGLVYAIRALLLKIVAPPLVLLDVHSDEQATPQEVERLMELARGSPVVLVVGALGSEAWGPLRPRVAAWLRRPVSVGEVVDAVRRLTPPGGAESGAEMSR